MHDNDLGIQAPSTLFLVISILLATACYISIHVLSHCIWSRYLPHRMASLKPVDRMLFSEKICSSINAFILGSAGLYVTFITDAYSQDVLHACSVHPVFCGYTLYDIGLLFIERPHWSMWVHHILGLCGGVSMLLVYRDLSFSTAFFTITEWTAFTTNAVWYAQRLYSSPVLIFYLGVFRLISFAVLRLPIAPYTIFYAQRQLGGMWILYNEMSKTPALSLQVGGMVLLFGTLNIVWTRAMLRSTLKLWRKYQVSKQKRE